MVLDICSYEMQLSLKKRLVKLNLPVRLGRGGRSGGARGVGGGRRSSSRSGTAGTCRLLAPGGVGLGCRGAGNGGGRVGLGGGNRSGGGEADGTLEAGVLTGLGHARAEGRIRLGGSVSRRGADVREVSHRHGLAGGEGGSGADESGGNEELHI